MTEQEGVEGQLTEAEQIAAEGRETGELLTSIVEGPGSSAEKLAALHLLAREAEVAYVTELTAGKYDQRVGTRHLLTQARYHLFNEDHGPQHGREAAALMATWQADPDRRASDFTRLRQKPTPPPQGSAPMQPGPAAQ